jgi:ADP-ribosylglycohydrolase
MVDETKRIFGAFYGQLVGDALGSRYEFKRSEDVKKLIEKDMVDGHLPLLGGGKFR